MKEKKNAFYILIILISILVTLTYFISILQMGLGRLSSHDVCFIMFKPKNISYKKIICKIDAHTTYNIIAVHIINIS